MINLFLMRILEKHHYICKYLNNNDYENGKSEQIEG